MPIVEVNVSNKLINEAVQEEIKVLKRKNLRLEDKIEKLKTQLSHNKDLVNKAQIVIDAVSQVGDFDDGGELWSQN